MLLSLYIKNLAIIDELNISFNDGLNIITGETGAGKSLIIKAIQLLMGKKFSAEILRTGSDTLIVEGNFNTNNKNTVIRRIYRENKQSKSFIDDEPVTQKELLKTTRLLADLHGQHDHQNLLDSKTHLHYLDSYGSYDSLLIKIKNVFSSVQKCEIKLKKLQLRQSELREKSELHDFQLTELTQYPLSVKFEKEIISKFNRLSRASEMQSSLSNVGILLEGSENGVIKYLNKIINELENISEFDNPILAIQKRIGENRIELEDIVLDIQRIKETILVDPDELEKVNDIISHIEMLKRKYGGSIDSVIEYRDSIIQAEIDSGGCITEIIKLEKVFQDLKNELGDHSTKLSYKRKSTADKLAKTIKYNLNHLNMADTVFKINLISDPENIIESGMDQCEFFISTNIGEELRPVAKIASGGEISRIMLAIKMALQSNDIVNTLIFDEIDSGISGATAEKIGETFEKLAESHQILCITHLSQIAGKGDTHFKVSKNIKGERIVVNVDKLSKKDRIGEVATLISGRKITESSKKQAEELLQANG
ncbi:MAG: DNA repair protein RecN [Candidatus Marinimicrobia bacterium]|nr:DNA repair protein RecN [Candidatus Neomarinimicrobiota bacterium]